MKLQVGSSLANGIYKEKEWINLDIIKLSGCNVLGSGTNLPFKNDTFEEIHCIHVLEHVTRDKYSIMLSEMCRVLRPGGVCYVETPDFKGTIDKISQAFERNDVTAIHIWTTSIYGKNERAGMAHHWGFYEGLLRLAMWDQGFKDVVRIVDKNEMISKHWKQEPVLLMRGTK